MSSIRSLPFTSSGDARIPPSPPSSLLPFLPHLHPFLPSSLISLPFPRTGCVVRQEELGAGSCLYATPIKALVHLIRLLRGGEVHLCFIVVVFFLRRGIVIGLLLVMMVAFLLLLLLLKSRLSLWCVSNRHVYFDHRHYHHIHRYRCCYHYRYHCLWNYYYCLCFSIAILIIMIIIAVIIIAIGVIYIFAIIIIIITIFILTSFSFF